MTDPDPPALRDVLRTRVRLVARAGVTGVAVGVAAFVATLTVGDSTLASRKSFALGALLFGFGLLGWSGSIMAGDGFEAMQEHLDVRTGWSEAASRRAMARIGGFGGGWMLGVTLGTAVLT